MTWYSPEQHGRSCRRAAASCQRASVEPAFLGQDHALHTWAATLSPASLPPLLAAAREISLSVLDAGHFAAQRSTFEAKTSRYAASPTLPTSAQLSFVAFLCIAQSHSLGRAALLSGSIALLQEFKRSLISAAVSGEFDVGDGVWAGGAGVSEVMRERSFEESIVAHLLARLGAG